MAQSKLKATMELFLDTRNATSDAKQFANNLKQQLSSIEAAADKMTVFKDMVDYIAQVDRALAALRAKNGDAFDNMFDGLDANLRQTLEELFGISGKGLNKLDVLREKLETLTPKSGISELRKYAQEINALYASVGAEGPLNIEDDFTKVRGSQKHIDLLTDACANFAAVWNDIASRVQGGFGVGTGGIAGSIQKTAEDIQVELDNLNQQMNELGAVQKKFKKAMDDMNAYETHGSIFAPDTKLEIQDVVNAMQEFAQAKKAVEDFKGSKKSLEYFETLSNYMQQSTKVASMYGMLTDPSSDNNLIYKKMQKLQRKGKDETYADTLGKMHKLARNNLAGTMFDPMLKYASSIDDQIDQLSSQMATLEDEMERTSPAAQNVGAGFATMGQHAVSATEYIRGMTIAIKEMFDALAQASDAEYKVLIGGQDIAIKRGSNEEVSKKTFAEAYLANIMQDTDVDAHSHQGIAANIDAPDFEQAIKRQYSGATKMSAIIGPKDIVTLDLAKVKAEDAREALKRLKEETARQGKESLGVKDFNKMMQEINPEYTNVAQRWDPSKFQDLATYIFNVKQSAEQSFTPLEKLKNLLTALTDGDIDFSKHEDLLSTVAADNVGSVFNEIAKREDIREDGHVLQVEDLSTGSTQDVLADIQRQKDAFAELRQSADVTYSEIAKAIKEYSQVYHNSQGKNNEFFTKYFHASEMDEIQKKFMDLGDGFRDLNGITRELAMEFGIDPDDIDSFERAEVAAQQAATKLKEFYELTDLIQSQDMQMSDIDIGKYTERLDAAEQELKALGDQGAITSEELDKVNGALATSRETLSNAALRNEQYEDYGGKYDYTYAAELAREERKNELLGLGNNAILESSIDALNEIIQKRKQLTSMAEQEGWFNDDELAAQKAITAEIENRVAAQKSLSASADEHKSAEKARSEGAQEAVSISRQQLQTEEAITAEKREQASLADSANNPPTPIDKESTSLKDIADKETLSMGDTHNEIAQYQSLLGVIQIVTDAVNEKTNAFKNEASIVGQSVQDEIASLNKLKSLLDEIQDAFKLISTMDGQKIGDINFGADKINEKSFSNVSESINKILGQILSVLQASTGVESDNKNAVKYKEPTANTGGTDDSEAVASLIGKLSSDIATESTLSAIKGSVDKLAAQQQIDNDEKLNTNKYALDQTLQGVAMSISEISSKLGNAGIIPNLVNNLRGMVSTLQSIAQGIIPQNNRGSSSNSSSAGDNNQNKTLSIGEQAKQAYDALGKEAQDASVQVKTTGDQAITTAKKVGAEIARVVETTKNGITTTTLAMSNENKIALEKTKRQFEDFNSDANLYFGKAAKIGANPEAQELYMQYLGTYNKLQLAIQDYDKAMASGSDTTRIQQNINVLQSELNGFETQLTAIANKSKSFLDGGALFAHLDGSGIKDSANSLKQLVVETESLAVAFRGVHDDGSKVIYDVLDNGIVKSYAVELDEVTGNVKKMELSEYGLVNAMQNVNKAAKQRQELDSVFDPSNDNINKSATVIKNYLQAKNDLDAAVKDAWDKAQQNGGIMDKSDLDAIYAMSQEVMRLGSTIQSEYKKISNIKDTGGIFSKLGGDINDNVESRMRKYISDSAKLSTQSVANIQYDSAAKIMTADLVGLSGEIAKVRIQYNELFDGVQITSLKSTQAIDKTAQKMSMLKTSISSAVGDGLIDKSLPKYQKYEHAVNSLANHIQKIQTGEITFDDAAISRWEFFRDVIVQTGDELLNIANINKANKQNIEGAFKSDKVQTENNFTKYNESIKEAAYLTQNLQDELSALGSLLSNINDPSDLSIWKESFAEIQQKIERSKEDFILRGKGSVNSLSGQLGNINFKELGFDINSQSLNADQAKIVNLYKEIQIEIAKCASAVKRGEQISTQAIQNNISSLMQEVNAYKQKYNIIDSRTKTKQAYGTTPIINAKAKYNTLQERAKGYMDDGSIVVTNAMAKYEESYRRLIALQDTFKNGQNVTDGQKAQFIQLKDECNKYANALKEVLDASDDLNSRGTNRQLVANDIDLNSVAGRANALKNYVQEIYGARANIKSLNGDATELTFTLKQSDGAIETMTASLNAARTAIVSTAQGVKQADSAFGSFSSVFQEIKQYAVARLGIDEMIQAVRTGVQYVREIDSALTELKKVTNETDVAYDQFLQDMSKTAGVIGGTISDLTTMAAEWSRLGYSMEESALLAENTAILLNVSEFDDATEASEALISVMQAFQYTANESGHVVDILNEVGNNYAVSSDGIATALKTSASALMEGGNSLEQATALVAAANKVVQDPNSVGSALRTISLRLRGTSVEILEEMGEETDGVVESTSKLQEKLKALTGVDILTSTGAYKDTYTILKEIGAVWQNIDPMDQAAALELMAGKNRANTLAAILNNMEDLEGAYESAMKADGSALQENETYLTSLEGRIKLLTNAFQTMWMNALDTDALKFFVDIATAVVKIVDKIGLLNTAVSTFVGVMSFKNTGKKFSSGVAQNTAEAKSEDLDTAATKRNTAVTKENTQAEKASAQASHDSAVADTAEAQAAAAAAAADMSEAQSSTAEAVADATATTNSAAAATADTMEAQASMQAAASDMTEAQASTAEAAAETVEATSSTSAATADAMEAAASAASTAADTAEAQASIQAATADSAEAVASTQAATADAAETAASAAAGVSNAAQAIGSIGKVAGKAVGGVSKLASAFSKLFKGGSLLGKLLGGVKGFLISAAIGVAIKGVIKLIDNMKMSAEEAAEAINKASDEINSISSGFKSKQQTVSDVAKRFAELAQGVDMISGKNLTLNTSDYEEFLNLSNQLATTFPTLSRNYDENGNAIVQLSGNANTMVSSLEHLLEVERQLANQEITSKLPDLYEGIAGQSKIYEDEIRDLQTQAETYKRQLESIASGELDSNLVETLLSGDSYNLHGKDVKLLTQMLEEYMTIFDNVGMQLEPQMDPVYEYDPETGENIISKWMIGIKDFETYSQEEIDSVRKNILGGAHKLASDYASDIEDVNRQIEATANKNKANWSQMTSGLFTWLQTEDSYKILSDESRAAVQTIINNLDFAELSKEFTGFSDLENYIRDNILSVFTNNALSNEVSNALAGMLKIQGDFKGGNLLFNSYKEQMLGFVNQIKNSGLPEEIQKQILQMFDIDFDQADSVGAEIDRMVKKAQDMVFFGGEKEQVLTLDYSDLQIIGNPDFEKYKVSDDVFLTWEQLVESIEAARRAMTEDFTTDNFADYADSIDSVQGSLSTLQEALSKLESGSFTIADFIDLIEQFPDLADGVDITSGSFDGLASNIARAMHSAPDALLDTLLRMRQQLVDAGKSTITIDQLINVVGEMPRDAVAGMSAEYITLADTISAATQAANELREAMGGNPNEGYDTRIDAVDQMKELMENGEIGSESALWDVAAKFGFTYDTAKTIQENADALYAFIEARDKWYQTDDDGNPTQKSIENFAETVEKVSKKPEFQELLQQNGVDHFEWSLEDGEFKFDFDNADLPAIIATLSQFKELAGLTEEEFQDLMVQIGQFYNINWENPSDFTDYLQQIADGTDAPTEKLKQFQQLLQQLFGTDTTINFSEREPVTKESLENKGWKTGGRGVPEDTTLFTKQFSNEDGTVTMTVTPILPDGEILTPQQLSQYATDIAEGADPAEYQFTVGDKTYTGEDIVVAKHEGADSAEQATEYRVELEKSLLMKQELEDPLEIETTINNDGIEGLSQISELKDSITTNDDGSTVINTDTFTAALQAAGYTEQGIAALITKIQEYNGVVSVTNSDPLGLSNAGASVGTVASALDSLGVSYSSLTQDVNGQPIEPTIEINAPDLVTALAEKGWTSEQISTYIQQLSSTTGVTLSAEVDTATIDAAVAAAAEKETTVPATVDYTLGTQDPPEDQTALVNYELGTQAPPETPPETTVNFGVNTTAVDSYEPVDENADVNFGVNETAVLAYQPSDKQASAQYTPTMAAWTPPTKYGTVIYRASGAGGGGGAVYSMPKVNGTAHAQGTAYKSGSWGAPETEEALVGELGPELRVRGSQWTLIGQNGAEFADVRKGDIIFNHKQTEELLKNGYVTGRGKAYAEGTAYASGSSKNKKYTFSTPSKNNKKKSSSSSSSKKAASSSSSAAKSSASAAKSSASAAKSSSKAAKSSSKAAKSSSKAADKFHEVFDWIEVRLEEINEDLDLKSAKLENAIGSINKNSLVDDMIKINKQLYDTLIAGAAKYSEYAEKLLAEVPETYREAAKDGSISIEEFTKEADEETITAIEEYREWVQKGADATRQAEETLTEISALAKQAIDNISEDYGNKISLRDSKLDQYDAYNALLETDIGYESANIYQAMMDENNENIASLQKQRDEMLAELNKRVEVGDIKKYSQDWYDVVNDISAVDTEIVELKTDTEDWQDAINELHWEHFDSLIDQLEMVADEADNLIDILSNSDVVDEAGDWTAEGITSLGLYAQQMEVAEVQAKKYQEEIKYLNDNWEELGYTEQEYIDKLDELKSGQYDAIKAYHDSKDAIVDLNSERVDAIKDGIQKEIDAYEELIDKKKEELSAEKDLYDFQKKIMKQEKDVADIQRQLAALAGDNSASARAQRAKLQAELAEANESLEEAYYDRSISNQQEALDKELENFQDEKDKEIEGWEEYLENTEQVVADSLVAIQNNTEVVYQTLQELGQEYGLSITEILTSPWKEGEYAIQAFSEKFGISMSATVEELKELELELKATMDEIESTGSSFSDTVDQNASGYQSAEYVEPVVPEEKEEETQETYPYGKASETSGNIKKGAKGQAVKAIQYALNKLGYGNSGTEKVDGIFGSGTRSAVKKFQKDMGISSDGIVGKNTRAKFKLKGYASGTTGIKNDQLAIIDELGLEEIVMHAQNGKLTYLTKGSAVLPHDISENLMKLGQLDPSTVLDQNKPSIGLHPEIHNTEISINMDIAEVVHIDRVENDTIPDLTKAIEKQMNSYMSKVNNSLKRFTR